MNSAKGPVGQHQTDQHTNCGSPRKKRKGQNKTLEEVMAENFPNLMKDMNINI